MEKTVMMHLFQNGNHTQPVIQTRWYLIQMQFHRKYSCIRHCERSVAIHELTGVIIHGLLHPFGVRNVGVPEALEGPKGNPL